MRNFSQWDDLPPELWEGVYEAVVHNNVRALLDRLGTYAYNGLACTADAYPATREQPAEACENVSLPGSDYCWEHNHEEV